ncbi:MAG: hypothetical protein ACYSW2_10470 [Planctomycetota bacterium]|jgi:hypothetical protein
MAGLEGSHRKYGEVGEQGPTVPWLGKLLAALLVVTVIAFAGFTWSQLYIPAPPKPPDDERFVWGMQTFVRGMITYRVINGEFPEDTPPGVLPDGFGQYARPSGEGCWGEFEHFPYFPDKTPLGGQWDIARNTLGITAAVGVDFDNSGPTRDDACMERMDRLLDDGDLTTGYFRKLAEDRYYFLVADYMTAVMELPNDS